MLLLIVNGHIYFKKGPFTKFLKSPNVHQREKNDLMTSVLTDIATNEKHDNTKLYNISSRSALNKNDEVLEAIPKREEGESDKKTQSSSNVSHQ